MGLDGKKGRPFGRLVSWGGHLRCLKDPPGVVCVRRPSGLGSSRKV